MEADGEQSDEDGSKEGEVRKKGKGMVDEGKLDEGQKQGGKDEAEKEQAEETDVDDKYDPHVDGDTLNEPNFIWNENKYNSWGKCYFKALEDDNVRLAQLLRTLWGPYKILRGSSSRRELNLGLG